MNIITQLNKYIDSSIKCILATVIKKEGHCPFEVGSKLILDESHQRSGTIGGGDIEKFIIEECKKLLINGDNKVVTFNLLGDQIELEGAVDTGMICGGKAEVYFECYSPNPDLYIFGGAGNVGIEIAKKAEGLDFNTVIVDTYNPELNLNFKHIADYEAALEEGIPENSYHLIVTGSHTDDYNILKGLVTAGVEHKYLGLLAAKKKRTELLRKLREETGKEPENFYSPVGFKIGGMKPAEIAISILAQIQAVKYDKIDKFR